MGVMGAGGLPVECQSRDPCSSEKVNTGLQLNVSKELLFIFFNVKYIFMNTIHRI